LPLYDRLKNEGRLLYRSGGDPASLRHGAVCAEGMTAEQVKERCIDAPALHSFSSIFKRSLDFSQRVPVHVEPLFDQSAVSIQVLQRKDFPLGDESYTGPLLKTEHTDPVLERQTV
jgi:hypothetical protein